ncbi:MAG: hypothetical protein ACKOXB_13005 [Flavobacteriales bacterium]
MKKVCLLWSALTFLLFFNVSAQQNIVRLSPLSIAKFKTRIHYERVLAPKVSAGLMGTAFFGIYPGGRVEPFARFYLSDEAPSGLYLQAKGHYSFNSITVTSTDANSNEVVYDHDFTEYGGSLNLGWQVLAGKNDNIAFDVYTGYRFSSLKSLDNVNTTTLSNTEAANLAAEVGYRVLHSNLFDLGVSVGYRF